MCQIRRSRARRVRDVPGDNSDSISYVRHRCTVFVEKQGDLPEREDQGEELAVVG